MLAVTYSLVLRIRPDFLEGSHSLAHCTDLLSRRGNTHVGSNPTPSAHVMNTSHVLVSMCEMPCWSSQVRTPPSQGGEHRFKSGTGYAEEDSINGAQLAGSLHRCPLPPKSPSVRSGSSYPGAEGRNGGMVSYPVLHLHSRFFQGYLKYGRIESSGMCDWDVRPHECSRQRSSGVGLIGKANVPCWFESSHQIYPIETLAAVCTVPRYPGLAFSEKSAGLPSFF